MSTAAESHEQPVVFGSSFEALVVRAAGARLDAAAHARLKGLGVDASQPFLPAYPMEVWVATVRVVAEALYPHLSSDEAHFELGRDFIRGLERTTVGQALFALGKVLGPKRMLERMTRNFRTSNNYLETTLVPLGKDRFELRTGITAQMLSQMKDKPMAPPEYMRGILVQSLQTGGSREVEVRLVSTEPESRSATYHVHFND